MKYIRVTNKVGILLNCGKYLHDYIISLRRDVLAPITSFTPALFIEVPVPSQESEWSDTFVF